MATPADTPAIEYRGVTFAYRHGDAPAVEGVTLAVPVGQRLGVLGPNGGGKSTLLKITLGLLEGYQGEVRVMGHSPREAARKRLVGYVPQRAEVERRFPLSVRQVASMGAAAAIAPWRAVPAGVRAQVDRALAEVGMLDLAGQPVGALSGGQLQRVLIARAIAPDPKILILDEPTVGVDPAGQRQFAELLVRLNQRLGLTMVVVSHDIRTIAAGSDRVACLARTLHSHVAPEGLTPQVLADVFRHDVAAIFGDVHVDAHSAAACDGRHHHPTAPVGLTVPTPTSRPSP